MSEELKYLYERYKAVEELIRESEDDDTKLQLMNELTILTNIIRKYKYVERADKIIEGDDWLIL